MMHTNSGEGERGEAECSDVEGEGEGHAVTRARCDEKCHDARDDDDHRAHQDSTSRLGELHHTRLSELFVKTPLGRTMSATIKTTSATMIWAFELR